MKWENSFKTYSLKDIHGRYIPPELIQSTLAPYQVYKKGVSENGLPIKCYKIGNGSNKVLVWSQMHGNESTTTKALLDVINYLSNDKSDKVKVLLDMLTIYYIPQLNPDGSKMFTRVNFNSIDLNRDFISLSQAESQFLHYVFTNLKPDYCFNLHDQRTIFSSGNANKPATLSFLAPAANKSKDLTHARLKTMALINNIYQYITEVTNVNIGRYDDTFNPNCVGDHFTKEGVPTILFEAGHYPNDYQREQTRQYIYIALLVALKAVSGEENNITIGKKESIANLYFSIPENKKLFYDIIIKNKTTGIDIALQYKEKLINNNIFFEPEVVETGNLSKFYAHQYLNI